MRRITVALALLAVLGLPLGLLLGPTTPAHAGVDDFRFSSMDAKYSLSTDADGHSTLRTVETLVAEFPESNQNHGIRRTLVDSYDGHPTGLRIQSVTDQNGTPRDYTVDEGTEVTIRDDDFVHGRQVYVLTYTQQNVTLPKSSSGNDEFYWDVNGTDWAQPFDRVTATVTVSPSLADALTGDVAAAQGTQGSTKSAAIERTGDRTVTASARNLAAHENLTLAIGFTAGTFTPRAGGVFDSPWPILSLVGALIALAGLIAAVALRRGRLADAPGRPTIVAEYRPPAGVGVVFAGHFLRRTATAAELLALAVDGHLRLVEKPGKGKPKFALKFMTADGVDDDGLVFLHALFGDPLVPGKERDVVSKNKNAITRIQSLYSGLPARAVREGYRRPIQSRTVAAVLVPVAVGGLAGLVFGIVSVVTVFGGFWPVLAIPVAVIALAIAPVLVIRRPLTAQGAELRDQLRGLEVYIKQAEADRLAYLQSPEGAERMRPSDGDQSGELADPRLSLGDASWLRLNEKLLPWAALVGEQKRWSRELGEHYEEGGSQPEWYAGHTAFTPAVFASSIGGFSTSTTSSFSAMNGGSTGGVSSGGGGGGGGGGGV